MDYGSVREYLFKSFLLIDNADTLMINSNYALLLCDSIAVVVSQTNCIYIRQSVKKLYICIE